MAITLVNPAGEQFVRRHLQHIPRPDRQAASAVREWARAQGHDLDPDTTDAVTLHYRGNQAIIAQRLSLTQAVLANWQGETSKNLIGQLFPAGWAGQWPGQTLHIVERLPEPGALDNSAPFSVFNGLFQRTSSARYDNATHLPIDVEALQRFVWNLDFHTRFVGMLDDYWRDAAQQHSKALQISFIAACNKQVQEGSLSATGRLLAWQAAGLAPRAKGFKARPLNIYGYAATDLIVMADAAHNQVLMYLPGNASPLHEFTGMAAMKDWVGEQCRDPQKRQALRQYFRLADTPDGLDFSGLDTALLGLGVYPAFPHRSPNRPGFTTDGTWPPRQYVNYKVSKYSPELTGDLFAAVTERQRARSYADADFTITRDHEVTKARWRGYLTTSINLLAPFAIVVPELVPLLAAAGIGQFGMGLDQAINGKSAEDKAEGVSGAVYGLLNALPMTAELATRATTLLPPPRGVFRAPIRLNEHLGYPLSPINPPHFPEPDVGAYFWEEVAAVPADDSPVAQSVIRTPVSQSGPPKLQSMIRGYNAEVLYDAEYDAFIASNALNDVQPVCYQVADGRPGLFRISPRERPVTDGMRMATLRGLGVDIQLPIQVPAIDTQAVQPIPKTLSSIWVGNKVIAPELLDNLAANARRLGSSPYRYRLYLSNADARAFEANRQLLATRAPGLEVVTLEEQPFYQLFRDGPHYPQYHQAINGLGANFSSASDILRYPLLNHEGGVYLDVDDTLFPHPDDPLDPSRAAIDTVELATTPDGLVLGDPANNDTLGMHCQYNSNMIGSHPNNPTLQVIADTLHERYLANGDFYGYKPMAGTPEFKAYAKRLSQLTGPGLLNDVIDRCLPRLRLLRQLSNLQTLPQSKPLYLVDSKQAEIIAAVQADQALNRVAQVGNYHSWGRP